MKKSFVLGSWAVLLAASAAQAAVKINSIDFKAGKDSSQLILKGDGPLKVVKQDNSPDKQVVLEVSDATLSRLALRKIDTSSFNSHVLLVSPYQVEGQANTVRIVVQLKEMVSTGVRGEGKAFELIIHETGKAAANDSPSVTVSETDPAVERDVLASSQSAADVGDLAAFDSSRKTQQFSGKKITLKLRDADLVDAFRFIGDASGFNIILSEDVKGKITLSMEDVPWDQALDVILHTFKLGAERNNNVLRVATLASLTQEKQEELRARKAAEASAPLVTKVFPVNYADLDSLRTILQQFISGNEGVTATSGNVSQVTTSGNVGVIQTDARTNSLVVRDIAENIERIAKLLEVLDTQTPQVLIEAKVVEASEEFSKNLSGNLGISGQGATQSFASFNGSNPVDSLLGTAGLTGASISRSSARAGLFGISPDLSFIPGTNRLNALLTIGESESAVKVVTSPKVVVTNKRQAQIVEGIPVAYTTAVPSGNGQSIPQITVVQANIGMTVTPTVTNEGSVQLNLDLSRDVSRNLDASGTNAAVAPRSIKTQVLVESGSTLVLGGLYTMQTDKSASGFPFLRKIPVIGWLFGSESESTSRSEIFFFITPRVLNPREAGMGT